MENADKERTSAHTNTEGSYADTLMPQKRKSFSVHVQMSNQLVQLKQERNTPMTHSACFVGKRLTCVPRGLHVALSATTSRKRIILPKYAARKFEAE